MFERFGKCARWVDSKPDTLTEGSQGLHPGVGVWHARCYAQLKTGAVGCGGVLRIWAEGPQVQDSVDSTSQRMAERVRSSSTYPTEPLK